MRFEGEGTVLRGRRDCASRENMLRSVGGYAVLRRKTSPVCFVGCAAGAAGLPKGKRMTGYRKKLLLSGEKRRRCDRPQTGVVTPGTSALTKLSPERATEYITCLISNCLYLCRPFGTFHVVAQLPGVITPVCGLSSLRDFRVSPHELLLP